MLAAQSALHSRTIPPHAIQFTELAAVIIASSVCVFKYLSHHELHADNSKQRGSLPCMFMCSRVSNCMGGTVNR